MQQSFKLIKCSNNREAYTVCLSHTCRSISPFICEVKNCKCVNLHYHCKTMKFQALQDYLVNWRKWINKQSKEFMTRVTKIFVNIKDKINRQQKIFEDFCKDLLLGKSYSLLTYLIEKRQFEQITSELLSNSIRKITQPIQCVFFDTFTLSQMKKIDEKIKSLMQSLQQLYKKKQVKTFQPQKIARSNSATLHRSNSYGQKQLAKSLKFNENPLNEIMKLKIDLSYPKSINSKIVQNAIALNKLIGKKVKKHHIAYRGSQSSFSICQFYRKIKLAHQKLQTNTLKNNEKSEFLTVILIKTEFSKVIGGFTYLKWQKTCQNYSYALESQEDDLNPQKYQTRKHINKFRCDNLATTNIFSLDLMERYDLIKPQQAIYCGKSSIGFGKGDIRIVEKGNSNRKNYCKFPCSFNNQKQPYPSISKSGMALSGSKYSPFFKLQQWEAFLIQI